MWLGWSNGWEAMPSPSIQPEDSTGHLLRRLVDGENIDSIVIEIPEETREDFTVTEERSGQQYRFVLPGSPLRESEWKECLDASASKRSQRPNWITK